jgi:hypothetical protein
MLRMNPEASGAGKAAETSMALPHTDSG